MNVASVEISENVLVIPRTFLPNAERFRMEVTDRAIKVHFDQVDSLLIENDGADREMAAYIEMHPRLLREYANEFVAIYNGELVDHGNDFWEVWERVGKTYPNEYVWVSQVLEEPIETVNMPSVRYE